MNNNIQVRKGIKIEVIIFVYGVLYASLGLLVLISVIPIYIVLINTLYHTV